MERRFNIITYIQIFEDIFKWIKDIFRYLSNWRYFQIIEYMLKRRSIYN